MAEYYLISQLPSLDGISENASVPISEEQFTELCNRFINKKSQDVLNNLTISPPRNAVSSGVALIDAWNDSERKLRLALGVIRADRMGKFFDIHNTIIPSEYIKVAQSAIEFENPLEAEIYLNRFRLQILESLRPMDNFSDDYIFYYGLRLKLILRMKKFDMVSGEKAYRRIYNSIINGENLEAIQ